uniref:Uncharacterized protein n=1 Tax=Ixodes ricinus TaxID=34613 RepID=A0A6B0UGP2_IXORI
MLISDAHNPTSLLVILSVLGKATSLSRDASHSAMAALRALARIGHMATLEVLPMAHYAVQRESFPLAITQLLGACILYTLPLFTPVHHHQIKMSLPRCVKWIPFR